MPLHDNDIDHDRYYDFIVMAVMLCIQSVTLLGRTTPFFIFTEKKGRCNNGTYVRTTIYVYNDFNPYFLIEILATVQINLALGHLYYTYYLL